MNDDTFMDGTLYEWWKYLTCCMWRRRRILVAPGNWECPACGTVHLS